MTTGERIVRELRQRGPLKDSELALSLGVSHQQVNQAARRLQAQGVLRRTALADQVLRNELITDSAGTKVAPSSSRMPSSSTSSARRSLPTLGSRAQGSVSSRRELLGLGFEEHQLQVLGIADALATGDGLRWNTLGDVPIGPGLYCFVAEDFSPVDFRVMYVGLSTQLSAIATGVDPVRGSRGGQRYGRPQRAGVTRKRVNAEVTRLMNEGQRITHWFRLDSGASNPPLADSLLAAEELLIQRWDLRQLGWNRG